MGALLVLLLLAADPFWSAKPPNQWSDLELVALLSGSPWAQYAAGPGTAAPPSAALVYLATASPIRLAEEERERRARLKRPAKEVSESDVILDEYRDWENQNRDSQIILAIRIPDIQAFSDQREVKRMEDGCIMHAGKKKIKITGHFPPTPSDPYLRLAFPRKVEMSDKTLSFDLYLPGVPVPFRTVEFFLKDMQVNGALEL